ncbi:hypothetical protein SAMN05444169_2929 [Bradyrhizobium erythrophlei]|jgi:hypothetical protein|uniref:Uncharacterized protein n=1 Tax=Bradyrhizobium erythrophlei TaxID=1437360 RepID=A0A1M5KMW2_9BRAD|nr:hypothetical protein SAMN05444169_2929 [Bradyrhizobium erythrophlei]
MKKPRTPAPKDVIRKPRDTRALCFQYAELLDLRKAVEDAESKGTSRAKRSPDQPSRLIKPLIN